MAEHLKCSERSSSTFSGDCAISLTNRWLYTSEGMGDVVEWISDQDDVGLGFLGPSEVFSGNLRDSRGRKGGLDDRREKLGQVGTIPQ